MTRASRPKYYAAYYAFRGWCVMFRMALTTDEVVAEGLDHAQAALVVYWLNRVATTTGTKGHL